MLCMSYVGQPGGAGEPLRVGHAGSAEGPGRAGQQASWAGRGAGWVWAGHDRKAGDCPLTLWSALHSFPLSLSKGLISSGDSFKWCTMHTYIYTLIHTAHAHVYTQHMRLHQVLEFVSSRHRGPLVRGQDIQPKQKSLLEHGCSGFSCKLWWKQHLVQHFWYVFQIISSHFISFNL